VKQKHLPGPPKTVVNRYAVGSFALSLFLILMLSFPARAQSNRITCTGTLVDVWLRANAGWPLGVIYDADGHYACAIDRSGAGHEPLKPCSFGEKCRVVGVFRKVGETYWIRTIVSVDRAE